MPLVLRTPHLLFRPVQQATFRQHIWSSPSEKLNCLNCDAEMSINHQCEANDSDSSWEDIENEEDLYPKLDVESDDWAEKFTNSIRDYHGLDESK